MPLPDTRPTPPSALGGGAGGQGDCCLRLTAHSPVQSDCPLVSWSSWPTRCPAWASPCSSPGWLPTTEPNSQCLLPRSQMLPLEKIASQFEILVLWSLLREDEEERFKVVVWKCQRLLESISAYYTLSCQGLSSWCFHFCNQVIPAQPLQALWWKGEMGGKGWEGCVCKLLLSWPGAPALGVFCFLFV